MKKAKHRMSTSLAIALALLLMLSVSACGGGNGDGSGGGNGSSPAAQQPVGDTPGQSSQPASPEQQPQQTQQPTTASEAQPPEPVEIIVFAAASMTETLTEISNIYKAAAPHVTLVFNFDSSGTLKTQIEEGAVCDVFISAAPRQMNELEEIDLILKDTRINLLENKVALVVPPNNPKDITGFESLVEALLGGNILMAMGNSDVPVGQYTQRILDFFDLDESALARSGVLTYGSNVKEVTTQVTEASVDCGIVYATDAFSAKLDIVGYATAEMCGQVIYPISVLKGSANAEAARAFLDYLKTRPAMEVFENVGFSAA